MTERRSPEGPSQHRTSSSDSETLLHQSPQETQSDPQNENKLGTRIEDLESQLVQAHEELKGLKNQLASVEAAKEAAQEQLQKTTKKAPVPDTDVLEVPLDQKFSNVELKITPLKAKLEEKEKEHQVIIQESKILKNVLNEMTMQISSSMAKTEEMNLKFDQVMHELETSKTNVLKMTEKVEATEIEKEALESEMKKLRVQTEQWKKAADVASAVLSERCGSMNDKSFGVNVFEPAVVGGYGGFVASPAWVDLDHDSDDGFGQGKKKGTSGIKMFIDMWKKKSHK